jgi:hypothetical protein
MDSDPSSATKSQGGQSMSGSGSAMDEAGKTSTSDPATTR